MADDTCLGVTAWYSDLARNRLTFNEGEPESLLNQPDKRAMSNLKIVKLSESGLHEAEVEALARISECLPSNWLAYSNFEFRDKKIGNREIDLVLVTPNAILLVELKNWNGSLRSEGTHWILNGQDRGESPVAITDRKCKYLKELITKREKHNIGNFYVAPIVVLCGSANSMRLSSEDKGFVCSLEEFCKIKSPNQFSNLFPSVRKRHSHLNKEKEVFNRIFSTKVFDPRRLRYQGYVPDGRPIFTHRESLYQEFIAEQDVSPRYRALLRTWDLQQLPPAYGTRERWKEVAGREREVVGYAKGELPRAFVGSALLTAVGATPEEEFSSKYFELYDLPGRMDMLDVYINKHDSRLTLRERIELVSVLLSTFSEFHQANLAHRDISSTCIWTGDDHSLAVSRWLAATYPEGQTVGPVREFLRSGRSVTPEDKLEEPSNPFRRDVFLLGALAYYLLTSSHPPLNDSVAEFPDVGHDTFPSELPPRLTACLTRALSWNPSERFANATEFHHEFQAIAQESESSAPLFAEELSEFVTDGHPYADYPIKNELARSHVHVYESHIDHRDVIVKVWSGVRISDDDPGANHRLLEFFGAARDINRVNPAITQEIIDYGLTAVGAHLVSIKLDGCSLSEYISRDAQTLDQRLGLCSRLLGAVSTLHAMGIAHGDIKPENIVVTPCEDGSNACVKFVDCPDIDIDGNGKDTPSYLTNCPESADRFARDRHAALMTVVKILGGKITTSAGVSIMSFEAVELEGLEEEIARLTSQDDELLTLETIESSIEDARNKINREALIRVTIPLRSIEARTQLLPDDDEYRIHISDTPLHVIKRLDINTPPEKCLQISIAGVDGVLRLIWDDIRKEILTGDLIQNPAWKCPGRPVCSVRAFFVFVPAIQSDYLPLQEVLAATISDAVERHVQNRSVSAKASMGDDESAVDGTEFKEIETDAESAFGGDVAKMWQALIDAEADVLPELVVSEEPIHVRGKSGRILISYESKNGQPIEFDRGEVVVVEALNNAGKYVPLGTLVGDLVSSEVIGVDLSRGQVPSPNDTLRLNSALGKASHDKRARAVERLIDGEGCHPTLFKWLSGAAEQNEIDGLDELCEHDDFCNKFRLNLDQCAAIKKVLRIPPIGLIQGPPGTGKTYFIAAMVHKLLDDGARNILLTSQSHEAVNNAIEKLKNIYSEDLDKLDVVRVGPLNMCSEGVSRYHIDNLQHRYRKIFDSDIRNRIEFTARGLGLPQKFVSQYVRLAIATDPLLDEYVAKSEDVNDDDADHERVKRELESIKNAIYGRARRISVRLSDYEDYDDPCQAVARMKIHLSAVHDVTNEAAIGRLDDLIKLAFDWSHALVSPHGNFGEFLTRTKRIVCGTCVGIGRRELNITQHHHEWVIIDEAARCSAGELAVPAQTAQRLVLVGDHKQLPPMYTPEVLRAAAARLGVTKTRRLGESDFRRVIESPFGRSAAQLLHLQYRMKPSIAALVSDTFYDGKLKTKKDQILIKEGGIPSPFEADVIWCDTSSMGNSAKERQETLPGGAEGTSFVNLGEARTILELLKLLEASTQFIEVARALSSKGEKPIGIICTYAGQKREIVRQLRQRNFSEGFYDMVKVDTVDSYQGKENLIIVLSLVRNNSKKKTGFLAHDERVNVAVSRAMERLVVVGSSEMWGGMSDPPSKVYNYIKSRHEDDYAYSVVDATSIGVS